VNNITHNLLLDYHLNLANADFIASAALQGICSSTLQLHALRPRKRDFANSTCYMRQTRRL